MVFFINKLDKIESGIINDISLDFKISPSTTQVSLVYGVIKKNLFGENEGPFMFDESELYSNKEDASNDIPNKYIIVNMDYPEKLKAVTDSDNELVIFRKIKPAETYAKKICNTYKIIKI